VISLRKDYSILACPPFLLLDLLAPSSPPSLPPYLFACDDRGEGKAVGDGLAQSDDVGGHA